MKCMNRLPTWQTDEAQTSYSTDVTMGVQSSFHQSNLFTAYPAHLSELGFV